MGFKTGGDPHSWVKVTGVEISITATVTVSRQLQVLIGWGIFMDLL